MYLFGLTKRTGEANMYPKPLQDLSGWNVRSVGCSQTSIVVAADESVIAWGASPTYGELGIGEMRKSSTTPIEVKSLDGVHVNQVWFILKIVELKTNFKFFRLHADWRIRF